MMIQSVSLGNVITQIMNHTVSRAPRRWYGVFIETSLLRDCVICFSIVFALYICLKHPSPLLVFSLVCSLHHFKDIKPLLAITVWLGKSALKTVKRWCWFGVRLGKSALRRWNDDADLGSVLWRERPSYLGSEEGEHRAALLPDPPSQRRPLAPPWRTHPRLQGGWETEKRDRKRETGSGEEEGRDRDEKSETGRRREDCSN